MLQLPTRKAYRNPADDVQNLIEESEYFDLKGLLKASRRQISLVLAGACAGVGVAVLYAATCTPLYTATASLIIDRRQVRAVQDVSAVMDVGLTAPNGVDSQVEVLRSPRIALAVVDRLNLIDDPVFWQPQGWLLTWVYRWITRGVNSFAAWLRPQTELISDPARRSEAQKYAAARRLAENTTIARIGQTYVITVSYSASDPGQASNVANAFVHAYLDDQLDSGYKATKQANSWLQERLEALRKQSVSSDLAVQEFRAANNLISVGGQPIIDLQLGELNAQLSIARGDVVRTGARLDRIRSILDGRQADRGFETLVGELTQSSLIDGLRVRYSEASRREAEIVGQFGENHERALQFRAEKAAIYGQVVAEIARAAEGYEGEYEVAKARLATLDRNVQHLAAVAAEAHDKMAKMRELEQSAETYRNLYRSFLERYQQTIQQQSFPMSDARFITSASPPPQPSTPRTFPVMLLSAFLGAMIGGAGGVLREFRDASFRTGQQIREELGLTCLGRLPLLSGPSNSRRRSNARTHTLSSVTPPTLSHLITHVANDPDSTFTKNLRSVATAAVQSCTSGQARVIGIASAAPQEGRTLIAANLATIFAVEGSRTLLVDADVTNPTLSKILTPEAETGLLEVLAGSEVWSQVLHRVHHSKLHFLPTAQRGNQADSVSLVTCTHFEQMLSEASKTFEAIIVDLPPLGLAGCTRALASKVDGLVLAVDWGRTPTFDVKVALDENKGIESRCIGAVLNRVDMKRLALYESSPLLVNNTRPA